jgi:hypothetical protein
VVVRDATRHARLPRPILLSKILRELTPVDDDACQSEAIRKSKTRPRRSQPRSTDYLLPNSTKGKPTSTIDLSTEEARPPLSLSFRSVRPPEEERGELADERRLSRRFSQERGCGDYFCDMARCLLRLARRRHSRPPAPADGRHHSWGYMSKSSLKLAIVLPKIAYNWCDDKDCYTMIQFI